MTSLLKKLSLSIKIHLIKPLCSLNSQFLLRNDRALGKGKSDKKTRTPKKKNKNNASGIGDPFLGPIIVDIAMFHG